MEKDVGLGRRTQKAEKEGFSRSRSTRKHDTPRADRTHPVVIGRSFAVTLVRLAVGRVCRVCPTALLAVVASNSSTTILRTVSQPIRYGSRPICYAVVFFRVLPGTWTIKIIRGDSLQCSLAVF